jgi:transcriptional antiterminator
LLKIQQLEQREPEKVEIIKEVPVEIVKEVIVEKMVGDDSKQKMLEQTLQTLRSDTIQKDKKIKELEEIIESFEKFKDNVGAVYLRGSNLDETLYK